MDQKELKMLESMSKSLFDISKTIKNIEKKGSNQNLTQSNDNVSFLKGALFILNRLVYNESTQSYDISAEQMIELENVLSTDYHWNGSYYDDKPLVRYEQMQRYLDKNHREKNNGLNRN